MQLVCGSITILFSAKTTSRLLEEGFNELMLDMCAINLTNKLGETIELGIEQVYYSDLEDGNEWEGFQLEKDTEELES
jgi:hypothetical protein